MVLCRVKRLIGGSQMMIMVSKGPLLYTQCVGTRADASAGHRGLAPNPGHDGHDQEGKGVKKVTNMCLWDEFNYDNRRSIMTF